MSEERPPASGDPSVKQTEMTFPAPPASAAPSAPAGVRLEVDGDAVGWIVFDLPGEPVNKLTTPVMESLRDLLDQALRRNVQGLAFVSGKPDMFIAGADVTEIAGVTDPRLGAEKAAHGQAVFEAIARFPRPTVAVITGACVGGGYELALACALRIAEDAPPVRIGLPETKLGILPGFGGTQRLPRRAGLPTALDVILGGRTLPARPAFRRGLVDALVPAGMGRQIAREAILGKRAIAPHEPARRDRWMAAIPPLRRLILDRTRKMLASRVRREHYPSPYLALEAIEAGYTRGDVAAYGHEAKLLGEAIVTDTCRNLTWLFLEQGKSKEPQGIDLALGRRPGKLAAVGAGVMGGGIAWLAGERGFPIRVKDIRPDALDGALATAGGLWHKAVSRRRLTPRERDRRLEKLSFTLDFSGFRSVDFAIEAVVEDLEIKRRVIADLEAVLHDDAIIASNTSSLRIADLAAGAARPGRIVGLHFFNPVDRMPLVEVVRGPATDERAAATAYRLALDLGKTPILVRDGAGFLVNRLLAFYLGEALNLVESGAAPDALDRALVDFGMPMGPVALLDQIGIDVADKVVKVMRAAYGTRLPTQSTLGRLVAGGHLGRKSGRGFYTYDAGGKAQGASPEGIAAAAAPARRDVPADEAVDRLLLPMVNEAAICLEEGVVTRPLDVDLGMVMGTGFPPFRGGLLRWADRRGVSTVIARLESFAARDPRFAPSPALRARQSGFYA